MNTMNKYQNWINVYLSIGVSATLSWLHVTNLLNRPLLPVAPLKEAHHLKTSFFHQRRNVGASVDKLIISRRCFICWRIFLNIILEHYIIYIYIYIICILYIHTWFTMCCNRILLQSRRFGEFGGRKVSVAGIHFEWWIDESPGVFLEFSVSGRA